MASSDPDRERDGLRTFAALMLIVVLVAIAREVGLDFQLPTNGLADERVYIEHLAAFTSGAPNVNALPGAATYPHLVSKLALATWSPLRCTSADLDGHLAAASSLAVQVRRVVAWLSLLAIPGMWLLVRAFSSRGTALLAAALCGTSLFAEVFSQQGRPHGAIFGLSVFALALAVHLQRRPTFARALLAGIVAGLSFAALQSGVAMYVPVAVAILLARDIGLVRRIELLVTAGIPVCIAFAWAYPYLFITHVDHSLQPGHALLGEGSFSLAMLTGRGFPTLARALWIYEPIGVVTTLLAGVFAIGLGLRALRRPGRITIESDREPCALRRVFDLRTWSDTTRAAAVVAAYIGPYLILFGLYERTYTRYALALVPFVAWICAWFLAPRGPRARRWQAWIPAGILVAAQAALVAKLAYVRAMPDTLEQAARWLDRETPRAARIGLFPTDDLPLLRMAEQRAALRPRVAQDPNHHWLAYESQLPRGPWDANARDIETAWEVPPNRLVRGFLDAGVDYCILRTFQYYRPKNFDAVREDLARNGRLVATFLPVDEPEQGPFATREEYLTPARFDPWVVRLVRANTTGNVVEIWKLDRDR